MSWDLLLTSSTGAGKVHAGMYAGDGFALLCPAQQPKLLDVVSNEDGWTVTCGTCRNKLRDLVQPKHEAADVAGMARRAIRALVRRAGDGDTFALGELVELQTVLQNAITDAGGLLHALGGYSYTELAAELGVSRQAARQRFMLRNAS